MKKKTSHTGLYIAPGAGAGMYVTLAYFLTSENSQEKLKDLLGDISADFMNKKTGIHKDTVR